MRKRKLFFGARRRWPDSPRMQKLQVSWDIEAYSGVGNEDYYILQHIQGLEVDLMKGLSTMEIPAGWLKTGIPLGGLRRGDFYHYSTPCAKHDHLQWMFNNGLQDKLMICLEDSYVQPHYVPYHDFENLTVEPSDVVIRQANW